MKSNNKLTW